MVDISNYGILYPELVYDIWYFFSDLNTPGWLSADLKKRGININVKCSIDFSKKFSNKYKHTDKISPLQLWVISAICDRLCEKGFLRPIEPAGFNRSEGMEFYYNYASKDDLQKDKRIIANQLNRIVYGVRYIYEFNKRNVLPVVVEQKGKPHLGSCFKTIYGIVTAKHCISKMDKIHIQGVDNAILKTCDVLTEENIDIVLFRPKNVIADFIMDGFRIDETVHVLDNIMVMGYPTHSGFSNFITATVGSVAAIEDSYLNHCKLMFLTNKVKGGNSGGPVINDEGRVVGIVIGEPSAEGENYDNFGYGLALPSEYINRIVKNGKPFEENLNIVTEI